MPEIKKDIRGPTFVVAANDSLHKNEADYVCDGTDDQVEIQAAIDALPAGAGATGGTVQLSQGRFYISDTIVIDKNMRLTGTGSFLSTVIELVNNINQTMIETDVTTILTGLIVTNLTLNGNKANQTAGHGIDLQGAVGSFGAVVENVEVFEIKEDGIVVNIPCSWIIDNYINGCDSRGIDISGPAYSPNICTNFIQSCGTEGIQSVTAEAKIIANNIWDCQMGISLWLASYTYVLGNELTDNRYHGLAIAGGKKNIIIGNMAFRNSQGGAGTFHGIKLSSAAGQEPEGTLIQGNQTFDPQGIKTQGYGIYIAAGDYHSIIGNNVRGNLTGGIYVVAPGSHVTVKDNVGHFASGETRPFQKTINFNEVGTPYFSADPGDWTLGDGWSIDIPNNEADCDASQIADTDIEQGLANIEEGRKYKVTFTVANYVAGNVCPVVGGQEGTDRNANGQYTEVITAGDNGIFALRGDSNFNGSVKLVQVTYADIIDVEDGYAITDIWCEVVTTFDDAGPQTIDIGDGADPNGFLANANINLGVAGYYGVEADNRGVYLWDAVNSHARTKVYTGADAIDTDIGIGNVNGTQGQAIVYVKLTRLGG